MSGVLTMSGLLELVQEWQTLVIHERLANRSWDSLTEEQRAIKVGTEYQRSTRRINLEHRVLDLDLPPATPLAGAELEQEKRIEALTLERDRLAHELRLLRETVGQPVAVVVSEHRRKNAEAVHIVLSSEWQSTRRIWLVSGLKYGTALVALHDAVALGWAERQKPAAKATKAYFRLVPLSSDTPERSSSDTFAGGEG